MSWCLEAASEPVVKGEARPGEMVKLTIAGGQPTAGIQSKNMRWSRPP